MVILTTLTYLILVMTFKYFFKCINTDDSEPLLGQWFEDTVAPQEMAETDQSSIIENNDSNLSQNKDNLTVVPNKVDGHGFIILSTNILVFLNKHFLCSNNSYVAKYIKNGLTEHQIVILAAIIKDLDRESARSEVGLLRTNILS